uniref:Uncharacterized protein n=1 Tax=Hordeum vulgare subsp. vulgare TaxID=112509 RepID=A0A8I6WNU8_HORVV
MRWCGVFEGMAAPCCQHRPRMAGSGGWCRCQCQRVRRAGADGRRWSKQGTDTPTASHSHLTASKDGYRVQVQMRRIPFNPNHDEAVVSLEVFRSTTQLTRTFPACSTEVWKITLESHV